MKSETEVKDEIRLHYGLRPDFKLFTNPSGNGWAGKEKMHGNDRKGNSYVKLENPRRIAFGLQVGSSDLIGWLVLAGRPVFVALEVKKLDGKPTPEQVNFIEQVRAAGGIAGVVRGVLDVEILLDAYLNGRPLPEIK